VGAGVLALWGLRAALGRRGGDALSGTWGCGYPLPTPRMQYTASSFAAPLLVPFSVLSGLHEQRSPETFVTHSRDPILDRWLGPAWRGLRALAGLLRPVQHARLSMRLIYVEAVLVVLLLYLLFGGSVS
jgi:hypothetical protein